MAKTQILIVEDEGIVAKDLHNTLISLGYGVSASVSSGEEAIKKAAEMNVDIVLMDIVLDGDMDGVEAAAQIRVRFDIPVIYLTAYADDKTLQRAKITEPYGYILKPFQERELHTTIEIALYKHMMERRLKESEQWLATTLNSIGDAVMTTDSQGFVIFMNPVAEALTGWKEEDAAGKPLKWVFRIVNEETGREVEDPATKVLREGVIVGLANHTILIAKDGTRRAIDDSGAPILDKKGNIIGVVMVFRDITERQRMEEELQKAQKLESLGILAGGIAHDFNNVLMGILGNIMLAKEHKTPEDKVYERLTEAEKACLRAKDLSQQLLTFSRGGAPIKRIASVRELLKDAASFAVSGSNVRCEFAVADDLWPAEIDTGQISQVINNLIINANQAMPEGGIIKVRAENMVVDAGQALPLKEGMYIKISIEDQGIGIIKKHLPKIFDPYFTTKSKGSGLGLSVVYSIVKKHNGIVDVTSQPGVGATFFIDLPASVHGMAKKEKDTGEIAKGIGRILLMDDEEIVRDVTGEMLRYMGYGVEFAKDGAEAIELYINAKESGKPFDVVIMDLTIPGGMGGKEAMGKLLKIDPAVKAIVSSGYSNDPVMADFRGYGFSGVVSKPCGLKELGEALNKILVFSGKS
jgi:two-component system cell cycle sensor histidine kinase/response regulator CckA